MDFRRLTLVVLMCAQFTFGVSWVQACVIAHNQVTVDTVSSRFLLSVFSMRARYWPDGSPISVIVLPDAHADHKLFVKNQLKVFPYQLRGSWDRLVFSGAGTYPDVANSLADMQYIVAQTPGAIGYCDLKAKGGPNVKILQVK